VAATCVNIALHHLAKIEEVDLVISGPNYGRNVSSSLCMSSGTIGGAHEASLCGKKAVAVSFALYSEEGYQEEDVLRGCRIAAGVIRDLVESWPSEVHIFNINVPVFSGMPDTLEVYQTYIFQNPSGSMFKLQQATEDGPRSFRFRPDPSRFFSASPPLGSDAWAIKNKHVSVTPLLASFSEVQGTRAFVSTFKVAQGSSL